MTMEAEVQAIEKKVDSQATQLLNLNGRMGTAEKKLVSCEETMVEFGNQLESKWAVLGTLIQEYGLLQRRLENMENLLKNRNFWILRLPPGAKGEVNIPISQLVQSGWESAAKWQKELCENVMKGNYETLVSLDSVISKPSILSQIERGPEPCVGDEPEETEIPTEPSMDSPVPTHEISSWIKQEEELRIQDHQDSEEREIPADLRMDAELTIKTEEQRPEEGPSDLELPGPLPGQAEEGAFQDAEQEAAVESPRTSVSSPGNTLGELTQHERELKPVAAQLRGDAGIAPDACAQCGRNFTRKDILLSQERLHTGERPYTCADCGKSFRLKISFVKHQRATPRSGPIHVANARRASSATRRSCGTRRSTGESGRINATSATKATAARSTSRTTSGCPPGRGPSSAPPAGGASVKSSCLSRISGSTQGSGLINAQSVGKASVRNPSWPAATGATPVKSPTAAPSAGRASAPR
ncbi:unnamed protein product [Lepidochelys kempii]